MQLIQKIKTIYQSILIKFPRIRFWFNFFVILLFTAIVLFMCAMFLGSEIEDVSEFSEDSYDYESCNVQGIVMWGDMYTYKVEGEEGAVTSSDDITYFIDDAESRDNVKAILVEVDSYGGSPAAAEEIYEAFKHAQKPVIAYIRGAGTSAAYYAISGADYIFALKNSDIGGIGVTQSYVENVEANKKDGFNFVELSAGKFKDSGVADRALTQEERELFMRDLNIVHANFIEAVAEGRKLAIEKVRGLADGSMVLGEQAIQSGLIDAIGGYREAIMYIEDNYLNDQAEVCW